MRNTAQNKRFEWRLDNSGQLVFAIFDAGGSHLPALSTTVATPEGATDHAGTARVRFDPTGETYQLHLDSASGNVSSNVISLPIAEMTDLTSGRIGRDNRGCCTPVWEVDEVRIAVSAGDPAASVFEWKADGLGDWTRASFSWSFGGRARTDNPDSGGGSFVARAGASMAASITLVPALTHQSRTRHQFARSNSPAN